MGCLFCGKEIGPFQLLRDDEFCSSAHRKNYGDRLAKALLLAVAPDPVPAGPAGFLYTLQPPQGTTRQLADFRFIRDSVEYSPRFSVRWTLPLPSVLGSNPRRLRAAQAEAPAPRRCSHPALRTSEAGRALHTPPFGLSPADSTRKLPVATCHRTADYRPLTRSLNAASARERLLSSSHEFHAPPFSLCPEMEFQPSAVEPLPCLVTAWQAVPAPEPAAVAAAPRSPAAPACLSVSPAPCFPAMETVLASPRIAALHGFLPALAPGPVMIEVRQFAAPDRLPFDACAAVRLPGLAAVHPVDGQPPRAGTAPLKAGSKFHRAATPIEKPWTEPALISLPNDPALPSLPLVEAGTALPKGGFVRRPDSAAQAPAIRIHPAVAPIHGNSQPVAPALPLVEAGAALPIGNFIRRPDSAAQAPGIRVHAAVAPIHGNSQPVAPALPLAEAGAALPKGGFIRRPDSVAQAPGIRIHPAVAPLHRTPSPAPPALPPIEAVPAPEWGGQSASDLAIEPSAAALPAARPESLPVRPLPARAPAWNAEFPAHSALPHADFVLVSYCLGRGPVLGGRAFLKRLVNIALPPSLPAFSLNAEPASEMAAATPDTATEDTYPYSGFVPLEYHSHRIRSSAIVRMEWIAPHLQSALPVFAVNPLLEQLRDLTPRKPKRKSRAAVVAIPAPPERRARNTKWIRAAKAIAAGLLVGFVLWEGATTLGDGNRAVATQQDPIGPAAVETAAVRTSEAPGSTPARSSVPDRRTSSKGPIGWLRNTFAKRASVQVVDAFRNGMEAWGAPASKWAPGWSRHPDGYVHPGQLALFRPSLPLRNYRLEFFAQIENKSLSWVVRARDQKNYYAMKFAIVEPGLRPVIAVVHYPVVGGKQGRKVEMPLSVMVHNNEPYRVAVEVKGNRVVTSIEGQEVDSWTDSQLASGGVGFFSDAGERARLYWMKVSANDDFLGRVCGIVADALGDSSPTRAHMRPLDAPAGPSRPAAPAPHEGLALAAANMLVFSKRRVQLWEC